MIRTDWGIELLNPLWSHHTLRSLHIDGISSRCIAIHPLRDHGFSGLTHLHLSREEGFPRDILADIKTLFPLLKALSLSILLQRDNISSGKPLHGSKVERLNLSVSLEDAENCSSGCPHSPSHHMLVRTLGIYVANLYGRVRKARITVHWPGTDFEEPSVAESVYWSRIKELEEPVTWDLQRNT